MNRQTSEPENEIDADVNGHLATALFGGVIVILLLVIYATAMAA